MEGMLRQWGCRLGEEFCKPGKVEELARRLENYASEKLLSENLVPSLRIESVLSNQEINLHLYEAVEQLTPFGRGNPVPVFASKKMKVVGGPWVLKDQHLKLQVQCNGSRVDAIWWRNGALADNIKVGSQVDLAYTMSRDNYLGKDKLLLTIRDMQLP